MIETNTVVLAGFAALAFSVVFAYTGTLKVCTYRRYIVPLMLFVVAFLFSGESLAAILFGVSALMVFTGYMGYGKEIKAKNEKEESE